jgi:hypothetical protein
MGALESAFEAMRRMIPEDEECDWETPEGLSGWIVFSKKSPIDWGYVGPHWDVQDPRGGGYDNVYPPRK